MSQQRPHPKGRGTALNTQNRFEATRMEDDWEQLAIDDEMLDSRPLVPTEYFPDQTQSIVAENDSPDVSFRYSLNPYRGCSHGCSYCYARPSHEYLGMNGGIDFESKILVKHQAAQLLRDFLSRPAWQPELIVLSGVTDCYQPAEREFGVTRPVCKWPLSSANPSASSRRTRSFCGMPMCWLKWPPSIWSALTSASRLWMRRLLGI